jgi:hypothetical protein
VDRTWDLTSSLSEVVSIIVGADLGKYNNGLTVGNPTSGELISSLETSGLRIYNHVRRAHAEFF